jgi:PAS domain S-box-containing protein
MNGRHLTILASTLFVLMLVINIYQLGRQWSQSRTQLQSSLDRHAHTIAASIAPLLQQRDYQRLEKVLQVQLEIPVVDAVLVYSNQTSPTGTLEILASAGDRDDSDILTSFAAPIDYGEQVLGRVEVIGETRHLRESLEANFLLAVLNIIIVLAIAALFGLNTRRLTQSSRALSDAKAELEAVLSTTRATEEKFRTIYENAIEGIYQVLSNGRFLSVNPTFARIGGYKSPEDMVTSIEDANSQLYVDKERRQECLAMLQERDSVSNFESKLRRHDGIIIWISENIRAVRDMEGTLLYFEGFVTDITKRKAAEAEAKRALEEALSANTAKNRFLAILSHELRTPLSAIIGYAEMLLDEEAIARNDQAEEDLRKIISASEHLQVLISDLLDLSKVEGGTISFDLKTINVCETLEEIISTMEPTAQKMGNTLSLSCAANLGEMHVDVTRLRQVLFNVINNGLKYTENGEVSISAYRQLRKGEDWVIFCVQDSGQGMDEEQIRRLSEELSNPDLWTTRKDGSAGMGLTIGNRLIQAMGGFISVSSIQGKGSIFEVSLPARMKAEPVASLTTGAAGTAN